MPDPRLRARGRTGAHPAGPPPTAPQAAPVTAERIVSARGAFLLAGQKVVVGKQHARAVVQVAVDGGVLQVFHDGTLISTVARTSDKTLIRHRYNENQRQTG